MIYIMNKADIYIHTNPDRHYAPMLVLWLLLGAKVFTSESLFEKRMLALRN